MGHSLILFPHLVQVTMWPHSSSTQSMMASMQMRHKFSSAASWALTPSVDGKMKSYLSVAMVLFAASFNCAEFCARSSLPAGFQAFITACYINEFLICKTALLNVQFSCALCTCEVKVTKIKPMLSVIRFIVGLCSFTEIVNISRYVCTCRKTAFYTKRRVVINWWNQLKQAAYLNLLWWRLRGIFKALNLNKSIILGLILGLAQVLKQ